jgi:hypothetical protein
VARLEAVRKGPRICVTASRAPRFADRRPAGRANPLAGVVQVRAQGAPPEQQARERAQQLIIYLDGVEGATLAFLPDGPEAQAALDLARRGRTVARDLLRALNDLETERHARQAMQEARDRLLDMLRERAA